MSTNSNRVTGGIMIFVGLGMSFVAAAWPADSEYHFILWSVAATLFGSGIVLGQIGMMQDLQSGIEEIKKDVAAMTGKIDEVQKEIADLKKHAPGPDLGQTQIVRL